VYLGGEPVRIDVTLTGATPTGVQVALTPASGGPPIVTVLDGGGTASFEGLPAGVYRVEVAPTVGGPGAPSAVHDLLEVAP
jgi:hypothetical protein